ncbi:acetyl-CoA acetyltransferase [Caldinitratiruptor microaerophilus]|uniref:Acetyl-CoA acetyltransferase n=1 Tax=Caldinitratiruptor microaerophilus TaxID=671077 RepID=A0AA35CLP5_9FIRM|nr:acetyl-CoA acetyltransferase [Caldinitratiruptor microaerophilus]
MREVVIVSAVRTAVGRLGGVFKDVPPEVLAARVITAALERAGVPGEMVEEVIMGQAKQTQDAANLARVAALKAGLPVEVPAYTVNRQCGSGMQAVHNAAQAIACGLIDVAVAGGVESMSTAPFYLRGARFGLGSGNAVLADPNTESQPGSQPQETYGRLTMGMTAEILAERYGISREEQDRFALASHEKALAAIAAGAFKDEIVPVPVTAGKGETVLVDTDEHPRQTSLDALARLKPAFKPDGTVTAGNASGRNDGASAMVVMSAQRARELGLRPLAYIRGQAVAGVSPEVMGLGPVPATRKVLERTGLRLDQMDLVEINEAFAAQTLAVLRELPVDPARLNVRGGAIALGHPIGNSGARILVTLVHALRQTGGRYGLATLCIAGGQGIATVVEAAG